MSAPRVSTCSGPRWLRPAGKGFLPLPRVQSSQQDLHQHARGVGALHAASWEIPAGAHHLPASPRGRLPHPHLLREEGRSRVSSGFPPSIIYRRNTVYLPQEKHTSASELNVFSKMCKRFWIPDFREQIHVQDQCFRASGPESKHRSSAGGSRAVKILKH